ncbi:MAG: carbamoyl-phosphate synthase large subunit [Lachnospiraceae bacterium]|nr:carbamoyl-phosphate synthase large subunit [Lachnospiraceae bacterium]
MPKRDDIQKILVIGSGPIVIGQAAEFDYAGTQACLALREEGYEVILCNSNPATIMTDQAVADRIYMEPLTLEFIARIIRRERPDAILSGIGGQTGLNLAMQLERKGILAECSVELLGTKSSSIEQAEDREKFRALCTQLGEPVLPSGIAHSLEEGLEVASQIGYPVVLRPAFTLGGTGGGFADDEAACREILAGALALSPVHQVLVEKSVRGFKEIEYEVMRDANDTAITVCNMENVDPVGIHTGDSVVVCPSQTLTNREYHMLRDSALRIIRALRIEGGCNVQFALDPHSFDYYVIEVNPRVSRSSALASKASGYPIARVSAKIAAGMRLEEIALANTPACFEPSLDYVVTKMPRFPFDKFGDADCTLGTQMKATGETMAVGRTFEESLLKAVRSLETGHYHLFDAKYEQLSREELLAFIGEGTEDRLFAVAALLRQGADTAQIAALSGIDPFFIDGIRRITEMEKLLGTQPWLAESLREAKRLGFADREIAVLWETTEEKVLQFRTKNGILPVFKMIDTCASEFRSYVPYFYSTYEDENESAVTDRKKVVVLGAGPIRIGQGVEFDYSTVHAVQTIREAGYEAIIINNNPETVSTDYTCSDKLYFEPLDPESVMNVIEMERPEGVIATLGGQTAINLAQPLKERGVRIIGTDCDAIARAEDREQFERLLVDLQIPQPPGAAVSSVDEGIRAAQEIGYPVLVRPSFVLGGRAMQIVAREEELRTYLTEAVRVSPEHPVLVDKYIRGREVEVDAVCDGDDVFVPGIMELVERTGVHSGDSISIYPPVSLSAAVQEKIVDYTCRLGLGIGIVGLFNIQFIVDADESVYVIEVNPRSSRTVPFLSKATGRSLADIATRVILGRSLTRQGLSGANLEERDCCFVKVPEFSFAKLQGMDSFLSPEMKSTGEAIGYDRRLPRGMYKAMTAAGMKLQNYGTVVVTLADEDKEEALPLIRRFYELGFNIEATVGTAVFLKRHGIRTRLRRKLSEGSNEILECLSAGYVSYLICTRAILSGHHYIDGARIRQCAIRNGITTLTSLDTAAMLLTVLEDMTIGVAPLGAV